MKKLALSVIVVIAMLLSCTKESPVESISVDPPTQDTTITIPETGVEYNKKCSSLEFMGLWRLWLHIEKVPQNGSRSVLCDSIKLDNYSDSAHYKIKYYPKSGGEIILQSKQESKTGRVKRFTLL
jgi:hypothetical protein